MLGVGDVKVSVEVSPVPFVDEARAPGQFKLTYTHHGVDEATGANQYSFIAREFTAEGDWREFPIAHDEGMVYLHRILAADGKPGEEWYVSVI